MTIAGLLTGFRSSVTANNWVESTFQSYSIHGASADGAANDGPIWDEVVSYFGTTKGKTLSLRSISSTAAVPNTYVNNAGHVHFIYNNNSFSSVFDIFSSASYKSKCIVLCFASNINSASAYSLDLTMFRNTSRFYSNLNNGNQQTQQSGTLVWNQDNPVVSNMSGFSSNIAFTNCYTTTAQGQGGMLVSSSVINNTGTKGGYNFAQIQGTSFSLAHGVKDTSLDQAVCVVPIFPGSLSSNYSTTFGSRTNMARMLYSMCVWMCSPGI